MDYQIRDAKDFAMAGSRILDRFDNHSIATMNDIQGLRTSATQFLQACRQIDNLIGALEYQNSQQRIKK